MSYVCLWNPRWQTGAASAAELAPALLICVPRVCTDARGLVWADARGMDVRSVVAAITELLHERGQADVRIGAASTPIAAEVMARFGIRDSGFGIRDCRGVGVHAAGSDSVVVTNPESRIPNPDSAFLAPFPVDVLDPSPPLRALLAGIGIESCGDLAALDHESVEVRLGAEGSHLWRLARADDRRTIFAEVPRSLPHASLDWAEYALEDPERLLFVINALATRVCASLEELGEGAREIALAFSLANKECCTQQLRFARPTASRKTWMRQIRLLLERLTLPDAVTGILLRVESVAVRQSPQGDLFDRGFASARATEEALAQLVDDQGEIIVAPESSEHVLLERRTTWRTWDWEVGTRDSGFGTRNGREVGAPSRSPACRVVHEPQVHPPESRTAPRLTLQLLPSPQPITVVTTERRDHQVPVCYSEGSTCYELVEAAGPDRVSGGQWEEGVYAREYFRCVRSDGLLVWLCRDARADRWYLHGWWD